MNSNDTAVWDLISSLIQKGDVLVDVGANTGIYTELFLGKLEDTGKIFSIELSPETYATLKSKFEEKENVVTLNCAISDTNSNITYYKGRDSFTNNIVGHDMNYTKCEEAGEISAITLDSLLKDAGPIKLIKIDVEGAELSVLKGMKSIIKNVQFIMIECHLDNDWDAIRNVLLSEYGMHATNVLTGQIVDSKSSRPYQCLCRHPE